MCQKGEQNFRIFLMQYGFRQSENLSLVLFYLNDFNETMSNNFNGRSNLDNCIQSKLKICMHLFVLLYAEYTIILAESADELQRTLDSE